MDRRPDADRPGRRSYRDSNEADRGKNSEIDAALQEDFPVSHSISGLVLPDERQIVSHVDRRGPAGSTDQTGRWPTRRRNIYDRQFRRAAPALTLRRVCLRQGASRHVPLAQAR
jgi:hypothetical protein